MLVGTDYNGVGKLQYLFGQENLPILDSRYTESVEFEVLVPKKEEERIKKAVTEATSGKASVTAEKELLIKKFLHLKTDKIIQFPVPDIQLRKYLQSCSESSVVQEDGHCSQLELQRFYLPRQVRQLFFQMQHTVHPDVGKFHA